MKTGICVGLTENPDEGFKKANELGFETCQLLCWNDTLMTDEIAQKVKEAVDKYHVEITAFWCGWYPPAVWDFYSGPLTLGIVPPTYRFARSNMLLKGADFAKKIGVQDVVTHAGFIPENPNDPDYNGFICQIRFIAGHLKNNGQYFLFETGQETPVTLLRAIEDSGMDNLGINLDPANLLLYGKGNPVDAISVFGKYIRGVHAKDGEYPTNGRYLGQEKPIGKGRVNFPALIAALKKAGYDGALTIENEMSGENHINEIIESKKFLESLI